MIEIINKICAELPPGWMVKLCMERGAAWISLVDPFGGHPRLLEPPDSSDETIVEQLEDALYLAKEKART